MSFNIPGGRYAGTSTEFVKAYIDSKVSNLISSSPESLNTLKELAEAIGSDPAFFTTMATANTNLQNQINAIHTDSDAAELALSNRLNTLEADPTTATAVAAVQADVDANEAAALLARTALQNLLQAAIDAVQADVDQNETDGDAAVLAVQNDVDANETERKTYFKWESNLTKVVNPLRSSEIEIGNNIHIDPAAGYATQFDGNVEFDNNTVLSHGGTDLTATFAEINAFDGRLDTLEADPTTAAAVAAVQADVDQNESDADAAIALKAPLADPDFTGVLEVDTNARLEFADNLTKLHNVLRGTSIKIGNNIEMNPAAAGGRVEITGDLLLDISDVTNAADDTAAAAAGVAVGQVYRNGSVLMIRVS